jgi:hypothetical protein
MSKYFQDVYVYKEHVVYPVISSHIRKDNQFKIMADIFILPFVHEINEEINDLRKIEIRSRLCHP